MSQDDPQQARLRAAFATADAPPDPQSCPDAETVWSAVRGELPPAQLREVVDHTARCAACAEDWRLAAELNRQQAAGAADAADAADDAGAFPRRRGNVVHGRFGRWRPLAAAAALAAGLLISVGIYHQASLNPQEPAYREASHAGIRSLVPAGAALPRKAAVLRWSPLAGATGYDVQVSTEDLKSVATAKGLSAAQYRISEGALAPLPHGTKLLWRVDALRADGSHQASPTFTTPLE
jgi:anti-sigma factor RsiW